MQQILLNSQRIDLSNDINYVLKRKFKEEEPDREMKNYIFSMIDSTVMGTKSGTLGIIKKCLLLCIYIIKTHSLTSVIVYDFRKR